MDRFVGQLRSGLNIVHYLIQSEDCASWGTVQKFASIDQKLCPNMGFRTLRAEK